jgi:hypothetical protein
MKRGGMRMAYGFTILFQLQLFVFSLHATWMGMTIYSREIPINR